MSAIDQIHESKIVALTAVETVELTAVAGIDVDAPGILKGNRHQIDVTGSITVSFRLKGQAAYNTSAVVADTTTTFSLLNVERIKLVSAVGTPSVSVVSYSER